MEYDLFRTPERDFDVGDSGISGYYDKMLTILRAHSVEWLSAGYAWLWVLRWPFNSVVLQMGPHLTLAALVRIGMGLWTAYLMSPALAALYYRGKWRGLERRGLYFTLVNDHIQRVVHYRAATNLSIYDERTQGERQNDRISADHRRRSHFLQALRQLALQFGLWLLIPISLWLIPYLIGPQFQAALKEALTHINLNEAAAQAQANSPEFAHWLRRSDVHAILSSITFTFIGVTILFAMIVDPASQLWWVFYDHRIHEAGHQYVPGAHVLEPYLRQRTRESTRGEMIHGDSDFIDPDEGAWVMGG